MASLLVHAYESSVDPRQIMALVQGDITDGEPTLVRVHSSCVTGDLLDSLRCDCGSQLHLAPAKNRGGGTGRTGLSGAGGARHWT